MRVSSSLFEHKKRLPDSFLGGDEKAAELVTKVDADVC